MHIHKISSQKHIHFLKEERKDPITGDLILEGDEVVFCANCKSAFLKSSWEYMGKRHCESRKTLYIFPHTQSIKISKITFTKAHHFILSKKTDIDKLKRTLDNWEKEEQKLSIPKGTNIKRKETKVILGNFDLDKSPIVSITLIISLIICIGILLMGGLRGIEQNIVFGVTAFIAVLSLLLGYFYPQLFFDVKKTTIQVERNIPVLFFEKDNLCLYFHDETMCYRISYEKIEGMKFYYPSATYLNNFFYKIDIQTVDGDFLKLELKKQLHNKNYFLKKTESILQLVQSNSKDISVSFKVSLSKPIFYQFNEMRNTVENMRME